MSIKFVYKINDVIVEPVVFLFLKIRYKLRGKSFKLFSLTCLWKWRENVEL